MSTAGGMKLPTEPTEAELAQLVRGYPDSKLAELYQAARAHPATDWARRLSAEIGRRDALGTRIA